MGERFFQMNLFHLFLKLSGFFFIVICEKDVGLCKKRFCWNGSGAEAGSVFKCGNRPTLFQGHSGCSHFVVARTVFDPFPKLKAEDSIFDMKARL